VLIFRYANVLIKSEFFISTSFLISTLHINRKLSEQIWIYDLLIFQYADVLIKSIRFTGKSAHFFYQHISTLFFHQHIFSHQHISHQQKVIVTNMDL